MSKWPLILAAFVVFLGATLGSDVVARMSVGRETFGYAVSEHLYYAAIQPIGTAFLFLPFLGLAIICHFVRRASPDKFAFGLFSLFAGLLSYFYFKGYEGAQLALLERKWTAAALSVGFLPFISLLVLAVAFGAALAIRHFAQRDQSDG